MALAATFFLSVGSTAYAATPAGGQIRAGTSFALALKSDGTVAAWGLNSNGQLGDATTTTRSSPVTVAGLTNVAGLAAGSAHSLAVLNDGTVRAWGYNANGRLGDGTTTQRTSPVSLPTLSNVASVAAGNAFSLALKSDGTVWAWGLNTNGQLGNGTTTQSLIPVQVTGLTSVIAISAGNSFALALKSDGTVWAWGMNSSGQLGNGSTAQSLVPVQVPGLTAVTAIATGGAHVLALRSDGALRAWGLNTYGRLGDGTTTMRKSPVAVAALTGVTAIGAGASHSLAVKADGTAWGWGLNAAGQLGDGTLIDRTTPTTIPNVADAFAVDADSDFSLILRNDGSIACFGANTNGQFGDGTSTTGYLSPIQSTVWADLLSVTAGTSHSLAIRSDHSLWSWGLNTDGQLGDGTTTTRTSPVAVASLADVSVAAAGATHSLAVLNDGTVRAWGLNTNGQLGDGTTTKSALPVDVSTLTNVTSVAAGTSFSLALKSDGTVWSWGLNTNGQLGNGSTSQSLVPVQVTALTSVIAVTAGTSFSLALKSDGTVWSWGLNTNGQLGNGSTSQSLVPVQIISLTSVAAIAAGSAHALALRSDGTLRVWGLNTNGRLGDGTTTQRATPVTVSGIAGVASIGAGQSHSLAIKSDGTAWAWGLNSSGQLGDGTVTQRTTPTAIPTAIPVRLLRAGGTHTLAVLTDGTLRTWGSNASSQLAAPAFTRSAAALSLTPSDTDTDADGLPDAWELAYFDALLPQSWPHTSGGSIKIIAMISSSNGTGDSDRDGLSDIQEWVRGSDPLLLDADQDRLTDPVDSAPADFFDGVAPLLTIVGGNNQYSPINTFNADPFDIAVWNPAGTVPFVNAPVSFSVITGTGQLSLSNDGSSPLEATVATRTDADGTAQAHFRQPEAAGFISAITVHAGNASLDLTTTSLALQSIDDDDDGLTNAEEVVLGTNPKDPDTDHDNLTDGWEVAAGLSPTTPQRPGIPPHSPTGLSINEQTSSSVTLNWEAVTADPGRVIIGYLVYCNGELVARSQGLTHTIACEPEGDFWLYFTVRAVDDTGALSSASAECLVIPRGRAIGSEIRRAAATARRWGIPSPISKRLYRSFSLTLHEEQDDVTWYQDHLHLVNDLAWSVTGHGQAPDGTFSLVGEMNSEGRPDALPHSDWRYSGGDSASLVGCESASGYVGKIYEIPPVLAAAIGGSDSNFGYSGSGTFDYMVGPHVANRRTWSRVLTCTLADEYTETALLGYIGENYQIAMAMASGLPWNHGASCFQGETSTCGFDDGLPSNYGYRELERNDVQGIMAASIAGTQYRFSCESDVPVHFRWVEQFQSPAGEPPETIGRYEEVALPVGGIASTGTYTSNPPAVPGSVYVYLLDGDISLRPPYSEEKPTRAYLKGAMYVGECIPVGLNTWTNEVTTGIVATFTGDAETVRFYLVDPWILDWAGQAVAIELGIPVESGTDLWTHPNSPWNGAASSAWQLLAVALNPGKVDFSLKMTMGGMSFTATTPIQVLPRSSLAVDADRDGTIKLASEDDSDATTEDKPFRFWLNDDNDASMVPGDAGSEVVTNPSKDYLRNAAGCQRDLEDFARLWISTQGLNAAFKNGDMFLGLKWEVSSGAPAIKVFPAVETDGGDAYLKEASSGGAAERQTQQYALIDERYAGEAPNDSTHTTVGGTDVFVLPKTLFENLSETQPKTFLLFEGCSAGKGQLKLVILDKNKQVIGEGPGVWIDLEYIQSLYQRVKVTPRDPGGIPAPFVSGAFDANGSGTEPSDDGHPFIAPTDETKTALVFVHGSNISYESAKADAETMLKRLWWQGYKGRLVLFYWDTLVGPFDGEIPAHYNLNEYRAQKYGWALKNYVETVLPSDYAHNVVGHSLGNGVLVSALRAREAVNGSTIPGMTARNVIFMQAAMPASCFDSGATTLAELAALESPQTTPDGFSQMGYRGVVETGVHATLFSIYNENDFALGWWVTNQRLMKPENLAYRGYTRFYAWTASGGGYLWDYTDTSGTPVRCVEDVAESISFIARSRTTALGRMNVGGSVSGNLNITAGTELNFGSERPDHSGEFTRSIQQLVPFYRYIFERVR